jgi:hypothetical protein
MISAARGEVTRAESCNLILKRRRRWLIPAQGCFNPGLPIINVLNPERVNTAMPNPFRVSLFFISYPGLSQVPTPG